MTEKLNWDYDQHSGEQRAMYRGFRIRAVRDECAQNPFDPKTGFDNHWPMVVIYDGDRTNYDRHTGTAVDVPLERFTDAQLIHDQHALCKIFDHTPESIVECYGTIEAKKYCRDAVELGDCLQQAHSDLGRSAHLDTCEELYKLLGIPCLRETSRGYSQGDYAELLIVATPEAQEVLRAKPADMSDEDWTKALAEDLQAQADLYGAWAWGDVYGYIVERKVSGRPDEEDDEPEWEEVEDGSCWGYYGTDHDKSGLEEAACAVVDYLLDRKEAA